jgi:hypothetical protein
VLGIGNSIAGAVLGIVKAALVTWAVLYIALFFPLTPDLRNDLHRSALVAYITQPNSQLDGAIEQQMPWFMRPFVSPLFAHHRV